MYLPRLTRVNKAILIGSAGIFILNSIMELSLGFSLFPYLSLSFTGISKGLIYQLVTYPFVTKGILAIVFNSLLLWFIGSELEARWGTGFYLRFLGYSSLFAGVVYLAIATFGPNSWGMYPLFGLNGLSFALLIAYAMLFSERQLLFMMIFPLKAKYFCALLILIELYMGVFQPGGKLAWVHLFTLAFAFCYLKFKSGQARGVSFKLKLPKKGPKQTHLRIVREDSEKDEPPTYH